MNQLAIDFTARARKTDPETSHAAAARVNFAHGHYALILGSLGLHGPQTIYEIAAHTRLDHVQVARRASELGKAGRIEATEEVRPSPSGRNCRVWRVAEYSIGTEPEAA